VNACYLAADLIDIDDAWSYQRVIMASYFCGVSVVSLPWDALFAAL
jgi:hypothetical protein